MQPNKLLLDALTFKEVARPPVWLMRQAGRYLHEYRALKEKHTFLEMCKTPEIAAAVTLQPVEILDVDAAIIFSDILFPLELLGLNIDFTPGPTIANPLTTPSDLQRTQQGSLTSLHFLADALTTVRNEISTRYPDKALIGFAGAPWTLACYAIDHRHAKNFETAEILLHTHPREMQTLLTTLTDILIDYAQMQIEAGAEVFQLFDSWGGLLSTEQYQTFVIPQLQRIFAPLNKRHIPTILYINGGSHLLHLLPHTGASCISVDWRTDLTTTDQILPPTIALQGNLNPTALFGTPDQVRQSTEAMLTTIKRPTGYIANLGHGVLQGTPREGVRTFVDTVRSWGGIN